MLRAMRSVAVIAVIAVSATALCAETNDFKLKDAATAVKIAKAAFVQELGAAELRRMKSFDAVLKGDKWIVYLHPYKHGKIPHHGGTFDVEIAVDRASILSITAEM